MRYLSLSVDRACENLFDYPFKYNNPKFIKGTDSKAAQLEVELSNCGVFFMTMSFSVLMTIG